MVQAGKNLRLSLEAGEAIRIFSKRLGQDLERHLAVQRGIGGLIDLARSPLADEGGDFIVAESGADFESHGLWGLILAVILYMEGFEAPAGARNCQENANVRVKASSRNPAGQYDGNVMDVNAFDVLLLVFVGLLVLLGVLRGLTRLLIGTGALVAAFILAAQFHELVASLMVRVVEMSEPVANLAAYLAIVLGTMLAGSLVASALQRLLKTTMLGWADRLAGGAVGLLAALLSAALVVLPVVAYSPSGAAVLRNSVLAPYVTVVADIANPLVPDRLSEQYRDKMESLRQYWQRRRVASDQPPA